MEKKLILLAFVFISLNTFAQVQRKVGSTYKTDSTTINNEKDINGKSANKKDKRKTLKELHLTKEQKVKLRAMQQAKKSKMDEIMNDEALTEDQKRVKLKAIKKASAADLQEILTDEQKAKLKTMRKEKGNNSQMEQ